MGVNAFRDVQFAPLSEYVYFQEGPGIRKSQNVDDGVCYLNIRCFVDGRLDKTSMNKVSNLEAYGKYKHFLLDVGDFVVSSSGTLGRLVEVFPEDLPVMLNTSTIRFKPKDGSELDRVFLKYFLLSEGFQSQVRNLATGSVQLNYGPSHLQQVKIPVVPLSIQKAIVSIIEPIDKKIAINTAISKNLEKYAQAIYKSWFLDFDPVKAKMAGEKPFGMDDETAALFPESMEDSEFGPVPTGWSICKLGDICSTAIGGLWGKDDESVDSPSPYRCIRGVDMDDLKANGFAPRTPLRWDKAHNHEKRALNGKNILIAGSGAGPVGKSLLWDESMNLLFDGPVIYSNFVKRLECSSRTITSYVSSILSQMYSSGELFIYVNGTSVPNLQDGELLNGKRLVLPSEEILEKFDTLIRLNTIHRFSGINRNLVEIRDSLLPRLISGELQIPEEMLVS
jgi:type I restriction enzyme, S subunit